MNDYFARFSAAPASFKKSFMLLAAAWVCHPVFIYAFFFFNQAVSEAESLILRMAAISCCLCFLLFLIKKWARALVMMGNCFIVVYDIFVLAVSPPNKMLTLLCVCVALFAIFGSYWLFVKDSRDYFTLLNPKTDTPEETNPQKGPNHPR